MSDNIVTDFENPLRGKRHFGVEDKAEILLPLPVTGCSIAHYQIIGLSTKNFCTEIMIDVI